MRPAPPADVNARGRRGKRTASPSTASAANAAPSAPYDAAKPMRSANAPSAGAPTRAERGARVQQREARRGGLGLALGDRGIEQRLVEAGAEADAGGGGERARKGREPGSARPASARDAAAPAKSGRRGKRSVSGPPATHRRRARARAPRPRAPSGEVEAERRRERGLRRARQDERHAEHDERERADGVAWACTRILAAAAEESRVPLVALAGGDEARLRPRPLFFVSGAAGLIYEVVWVRESGTCSWRWSTGRARHALFSAGSGSGGRRGWTLFADAWLFAGTAHARVDGRIELAIGALRWRSCSWSRLAAAAVSSSTCRTRWASNGSLEQSSSLCDAVDSGLALPHPRC